ncbi:hypothetical protein AB5I41_23135 [Sphingomonas sp. MMS24-JH45]
MEAGGDLAAKVRLRDGRGFGVPVLDRRAAAAEGGSGEPQCRAAAGRGQDEADAAEGVTAGRELHLLAAADQRALRPHRHGRGRHRRRHEGRRADRRERCRRSSARRSRSARWCRAPRSAPPRGRCARGWCAVAECRAYGRRSPRWCGCQLDRLACVKKDEECALTGSDLFLVAAIAPVADFKGATAVPAGFVGTRLSVPRPAGDTLFLKLHDAPDAVIRAGLD